MPRRSQLCLTLDIFSTVNAYVQPLAPLPANPVSEPRLRQAGICNLYEINETLMENKTKPRFTLFAQRVGGDGYY